MVIFSTPSTVSSFVAPVAPGSFSPTKTGTADPAGGPGDQITTSEATSPALAASAPALPRFRSKSRPNQGAPTGAVSRSTSTGSKPESPGVLFESEVSTPFTVRGKCVARPVARLVLDPTSNAIWLGSNRKLRPPGPAMGKLIHSFIPE